MMLRLTQFLGANRALCRLSLLAGVTTCSLNQYPGCSRFRGFQ